MNLGSTIEYIPLGIFNIDEVEKTDYTVKFTCYDNMIKFEKPYFSSLGATATLTQIVNEICTKAGVQFIGTLPAYTLKKLEGYTYREVLSYVASLCGGNAIIDRTGKLKIVTLSDVNYSINADNYFELKREDSKYKITKLACQVGESILEKGTLGTGRELQFENPWVTSAILNDLYTKLNGLEYLGYSMKWQGDLSLDLGDLVTTIDKKGVVRKVPILYQKFNFNGGLTSEISAKGETENKNSFSSSGSSINKINRVVTELAIVNEALVSKANITDLTATNATIENLKVNKADISRLEANEAKVISLEATKANITELNAINANLVNLISAKANIIDLTATNIKFDVGTGGTLSLQTLLSNFISGNSGQFLNITGDNVVIANGVIKDAMIETVNASKVNTGALNTNFVDIQSGSGNLLIKDNTIQIKDSDRVRVQIGKDASNDYNMYVWDSTGKLMFDATGLKADGIKSKIIRDDMVSDTANISGSKLNISSVITAINNDNTTTLKSSKVLLDAEGQSLEVAFNSLKTNVSLKETRNLLTGTSKEWKTITLGQYAAGFIQRKHYSEYGLKVGDIITLSSILKFKTKKVRVRIESAPTVTGSDNRRIERGNIIDSNEGLSVVHLEVEVGRPYIGFQIDNVDFDTIQSSSVEEFKCLKLELGKNPNPVWSIAPEDIEEKIQANTTQLNVAQGNINTLISDNSINKGNITTLTNNYSSLNQTVSGISSTVASHTTSISAINTNVANANALADSKAKVFTATPTTPYKIGDIWTGGPSGELMRCKVARATGSYNSSDWEKASKYTDDTKANAVEGSLNTLSGTVTTVQNKQASLEQNLDGFKTTVSNTYSTKTELATTNGNVTSVANRVTATEGSITQLNNKIALKVESADITNAINNIEIGGRNLFVINTLKNQTGGGTNGNIYPSGFSSSPSRVRTDLIQIDNSIDYIIKKPIGFSVAYITFDANKVGLQDLGWIISGSKTTFQYKFNKDVAFVVIIVRRDDSEPLTIEDVKKLNIKFEKGNKATDWTPAPEDLESSINDIDTRLKSAELKITDSAIISTVSSTINTAKTEAINSANSSTDNKLKSYSTTSQMNTAITQSVDSITSTVSSTYATKTELGTVTGRVSTVEQSITASAITTTISSGLAGSNSINTTKFTLNKDGLTIKNGGLKIQNNAGTTVLSADSSGNLIVTASITSSVITGGTINGTKLTGVDITSKNFTAEQEIKLVAGGYSPQITFMNYPEGVNGASLTAMGHIYVNSSGQLYLQSKNQEIFADGELYATGSKVVESGSNSNGTFIKFYNGVMICRQRLPVTINFQATAGSVFYSGYNLTFPAAFSYTPNCNVSFNSGGSTWGSPTAITTELIIGTRIFSALAGSISGVLEYVAVGRWK